MASTDPAAAPRRDRRVAPDAPAREAWLPRSLAPLDGAPAGSFGTLPAFLAVFGLGVAQITYFFTAFLVPFPSLTAYVRAVQAGLAAALLLLLVLAAWSAAVALRWTRGDGGAGLAVAGMGTAAIAFGDVTQWFIWPWGAFQQTVVSSAPGAPALRAVGWTAYAMGLGATVVLFVLERRRARRAA